jgi:hypothetical protein
MPIGLSKEQREGGLKHFLIGDYNYKVRARLHMRDMTVFRSVPRASKCMLMSLCLALIALVNLDFAIKFSDRFALVCRLYAWCAKFP